MKKCIKRTNNFLLMLSISLSVLNFYLRPSNQKYLIAGTYSQEVWDAIFVYVFKSPSSGLLDKRWNVLFDDYHTITINNRVRKLLCWCRIPVCDKLKISIIINTKAA